MKKEILSKLLTDHAKVVDGKIEFDLDNIHTQVNVFGTDMRKKGTDEGKAEGASQAILDLGIDSVKDATALKTYITGLASEKTDTDKKLLGLTTEFETYKTDVSKSIDELKNEGLTAKKESLRVTNGFLPKYNAFVDKAADDYMAANEGKSLVEAYDNVKTTFPEWSEAVTKDSKGNPTPPSEKITEDEEKEMLALAGL